MALYGPCIPAAQEVLNGLGRVPRIDQHAIDLPACESNGCVLSYVDTKLTVPTVCE